MEKLFKGIIEKLFSSNQKSSQPNLPPISQDQVEAIVDARIKEHAATLESVSTQQGTTKPAGNEEDYTLTEKQIDYAFTLLEKVKDEFELAIDPTKLTVKDLNRLIAFNRYKNKGTLVNLVKKGVLRKK
ncbi:ABC transporter ATP-binding protein [Neobacillus sp. FSL H8-0543]|uniref:ABC transporter ATP-binding protein n=1 Tax=Neobacillus sp. FSL H8-0543 TaxID=2954672 RepID=UPI00315858B2